jgi:hypothetical protein
MFATRTPSSARRPLATAAATSIALAIALLATGCVAGSPSASDDAGAQSSAIPTTDPQPTGTAAPHPAYDGTKSGAPTVARKGKPVSERATAKPTTFTKPAVYSDKVTITASKFSREVVSGKGAGVMTGSPYVVFGLTITNHGSTKLNLSEVVVTLQYGATKTAAAPVYDDANVSDFSGTLAAGKSKTARYAFILPKKATTASLFVDTDATRLAAVFTGKLPL